jgi:hypothetical protein
MSRVIVEAGRSSKNAMENNVSQKFLYAALYFIRRPQRIFNTPAVSSSICLA